MTIPACPKCKSRVIPKADGSCPSCGLAGMEASPAIPEAAPPVPPAEPEAVAAPPSTPRARLLREITIFLLAFGLLLLGLGGLILSTLDPEAPELMGTPRHLALSVPLFGIGGVHVICGILLATTKKNVWAYVGTVSNGLLSVLYFIFMGYVAMAKGGRFSPNLLMILFAAMPILMAQRSVALSKAS